MDESESTDEEVGRPVRGIARRRLLAMAGGAAIALGTGGILAGCNGSNGGTGVDGGDGGGDGGGDTGDDSDDGGTTGGNTGGNTGGGSGGGSGGDDGGSDDAYVRHQGYGSAPSGVTA